MKNYLLAIIALCLTIIGCTKKQQISPTSPAQEMIQPTGLKGQNHIVPGIDQYRLLVRTMRQLLINTGIPQGAGSGTDTGHIGPLPNIRAAIESLN